jgi:hypothetical protein
MYRFECSVLLFALLPLIMAIIFRAAVMPRRKTNMVATLTSASDPAKGSFGDADSSGEASQYIAQGIMRVSGDFESLYSTRLIFPAFLLSLLYWIGLSLGLSILLAPGCAGLLCRQIHCVDRRFLMDPVFAVLGSYVFNIGVVVRRSFMADVTKNVFWACINRVAFSVGLSIALYPMFSYDSVPVLCFAIAFFPKLFITLIRKQTTKLLSVTETAIQELDLQLVQGIDVWKVERLEEEGIESIQNLATADVLSLAVKTHYPLRTIVDWMDQAILIQRFPAVFKALQQAGLPISAIEFAWMASHPDQSLLEIIVEKTGISGPVLLQAISSFAEDTAVRVLWRLWQSQDAD